MASPTRTRNPAAAPGRRSARTVRQSRRLRTRSEYERRVIAFFDGALLLGAGDRDQGGVT
jgi:hypothetical protein